MKKAITLIYKTIFILLMVGVNPALAQFSGGSGTQADPYQVATAADLDNVRNYLDSHFILTGNLDLSTATGDPSGDFWNAGAGWIAIGYDDTSTFMPVAFTGTFDGGGHTILGLYMSQADSAGVGLFKYLGSFGVIKNVGLANVDITGFTNVGGLIGGTVVGNPEMDTLPVIDSVFVTGTVTGGDNVGGVIGNQFAGNLSHAWSSATVVGTGGFAYYGGLVGYMDGGSISESYATGSVTESTGFGSQVGGLVGGAGGGIALTISDSYATGAVSGYDDVAGLVGAVFGGVTITNSYATGAVSGDVSAVNLGGLVGFEDDYTLETLGNTYNSSYWDSMTTGQASSAGGTAKTTTEMQTQSTFTGWDFTGTWQMDGYPGLRNLGFGPANFAPTATNVVVSNTSNPAQPPAEGDVLTVSYDYNDTEGDVESGTSIQWYRADDGAGTNAVLIAGATGTSYSVAAADAGKFLRVDITPSDGTNTGSTSSSSYVEVPILNTAPIVSNAVIDIVVNEDSSVTPIDFTDVFSDAEDNDADLIYTLVSNSNPSLVFTSVDNTQDILVILLQSNANGIADFTIQAEDSEGLTVQDSFTLTVNPVNDGPEFTLAGNQTIYEDDGEQIVENFLTVNSKGGTDESAQNLSILINTNNDSVFTNLPTIDLSTGILSYTAAPDSNGVVTVSVTVSDDGGTANGGTDQTIETFEINISAVNDEPFAKINYPNPVVDNNSGQYVQDLFIAYFEPGPSNESGQKPLEYAVSTGDSSLFEVQPKIEITGTAPSGGYQYAGTLTFTPSPDTSGVAAITVQVIDDGGTENGGVNTYEMGFVITINQSNRAPVAENVQVVGYPKIGTQITATYDFTDADGDTESGSTFQWYRADDANGAGEVAIIDSTAKTYTPTSADNFKYLRLDVTPNDGMDAGATISSGYILASIFDGGIGTEAEPFLISTAIQLDSIRTLNDPMAGIKDHFKLTSDIDLDVAPYNQGEGWIPLTRGISIVFSGSLDGNNHTISGLFINNNIQEYVGLIGHHVGTVKDLKLTNVNVTVSNDNNVGAIGYVSGGIVSKVHVTGSVTSTSPSSNGVGGIAGALWNDGAITESSFDGTVTGPIVGGIAGNIESYGDENTFISKSYSIGSVSGERAGGIVGGVNDGGTISDSYSLSTVSGSNFEGGIIGYSVATQSHNYFAGTLSGVETNALWNSNGIETSSLTKSAMRDSISFANAGFDFTNTWAIMTGDTVSHPYLKDNPQTPVPGKVKANSAPIVSTPITDVTVDENAPNTVIDLSANFSDAETASGALAYTIVLNDNTTLVTASIVGNTLTLDYHTNQFGVANITVSASDGELSVDDSFIITVNEVNNAPVFGTPYDLTKAEYAGLEKEFALPTDTTDLPYDITFSADGTRMFVVDFSFIHEYKLSVANDVSTAAHSGFAEGVNTFELANQSHLGAMSFSSDGSQMFVMGGGNGSFISKLNLSVPFDISTAVFAGSEQGYYFNPDREAYTTDFEFNADGTKMFALTYNGNGQISTNENSVLEYNLGAAYDVSTAVLADSFSVATQIINPKNLALNKDGSKMFVSTSDSIIVEYSLSTPYSLSSSVYKASHEKTNSSFLLHEAIAFNGNGTKMFLLDLGTFSVIEYNMGTPEKVSFAENESGTVIDVQATNGDGGATDIGITYSIIGGLDATAFTINSVSGELSFNAIPDFENPSDSDSDNVYEVTVQADDGEVSNNTTSITLTVTVTDVEENNAPIFATSYDVSTAVYAGDEEKFDVSAQDVNPLSLEFSNDGMKMFVLGYDNAVVEYELGVAYDVSTAVYSGIEEEFNFDAQEVTTHDFTFNTDGTKMYVIGVANDKVIEYNLSSAFDVSTAVHAAGEGYSVGVEFTRPYGLTFNSQGTKMYVLGSNETTEELLIVEYVLGMAFDVSTVTQSGTRNHFSLLSELISPKDLIFNGDGTKLFVLENSGISTDGYTLDGSVVEYSLGTAYDLSTVVYAGDDQTINVNNQESAPYGIEFNADGSKMYIIGFTDSVLEYNLASGTPTLVNFAENTTGTVIDIQATDGEGGAADVGLTYSIVGGADGDLFAINSSTGALTFKAAPDFENPSDVDADNMYEVTVQADDGQSSNNTASITLTVTVTDVEESKFFIADNGVTIIAKPGTQVGESETLMYDLDKDGVAEEVTFTLRDRQGIIALLDENENNPELARTVTTGITDMSSLFDYRENFNQNIGSWDVSSVTNMSRMFVWSNFDQDISNWNVSNVTTTYAMFGFATRFNQDLRNWDLSSTINTELMFSNAWSFNNGFSPGAAKRNNKGGTNTTTLNWDVSNVTNMASMFQGAKSFNQDISSWDISSVQYFDNAPDTSSTQAKVNSSAPDSISGFLVGSGMSSDNVSKMFVGWKDKVNTAVQSINIGSIELNTEGATALRALRESSNIVVSWGGEEGVDDEPIFSPLPEPFEILTEDTRILQLWDYVSDASTPDNALNFSFSVVSDSLQTIGFDTNSGELAITAPAYADTFFVAIQVANIDNIVALDTVEVHSSPMFTSSEDMVVDIPTEFDLMQNYPNPFNPSTVIRFGVPQAGEVRLEVFDLLGRKVATLLNNERRSAGWHQVTFDASNLSSGIYIYRIATGNYVKSHRMTLIK
ncbi:BspA family leucine-rich repeat surface protein [Balneola vulgaris]|uniref:BspA family leucine-rich repeat surface protein n=1 Tax=Balneola vulgaris TaxID=287535 RepID=UPI0003AABA71|nr:BspA family leucine-rich repeat surface protein [Balneola vulgaris]